MKNSPERSAREKIAVETFMRRMIEDDMLKFLIHLQKRKCLHNETF